LALSDNPAVAQHDWYAPVVEVVEAIVGVDVGQVRFVAEGAEQLESLIAEVAPLTGDQEKRHGRSGRQPQLLPRLDGRALQAVRSLDVVHTYPDIIARIVRRGDRPEGVAGLHHHRGLGRGGSAVRHQRQAEGRRHDQAQRRQQTDPQAAGTGCPQLCDPVSGGVHTFVTVANGRSPVKRTNKSLRLACRSASMALNVPHHDLEMNIKLTDQLTDRQTKILEFIRHVTRVRNYPPSVREIGEAVGLSSSSTVHNHLNQLERRGLIKRDPSKSRTVQLVQDANVDNQRRNAVSIPVIGNVAAGAPILAEENIEDHVLLSPDMAQEGFFLLRVRGESMMNAGILDGDLVLVRPQQEAPNGTIVVALVDGDATVKRFERGNGHVKLVAENPAYEPIVTTNVSLVGVVRGVIRMFR
jgi:repressor LexA